MSALGQKRTFAVHKAMSAKCQYQTWGQAQLVSYSMTSSARPSTAGGNVRPIAFGGFKIDH